MFAVETLSSVRYPDDVEDVLIKKLLQDPEGVNIRWHPESVCVFSRSEVWEFIF